MQRTLNLAFTSFLNTSKQVRTVFKLEQSTRRHISSKKSFIIMGIETSCDDTGCALIDHNGKVLGAALNSQHIIHLNNGGIIPTLAQDLHRENIEAVVDEAVKSANITFNEIDAIAVTVKPGLSLSLFIGMKYGKYLCRIHQKPFIPIHHMQAHALTARMLDSTIEFPFLVLLISGGHCLLAVARDVDDFLLLGQSLNDAPGEAFDKVARRMKLKNLPEYETLSGGRAIELAASRATNPLQYNFTIPLLHRKDCNFSMAGLKTQLLRHVIKDEQNLDVPADGVIPDFENLAAGFQLVVTQHLCHRVQRAMEYAALKKLIPENKKTLVVSGGAACNNFIAKGLGIVCDELGYRLARPPPHLCTDNGVMIAWNGVEKWRLGRGITTDLASITTENSSPIGEDLSEDVVAAKLSCKWVKLNSLTVPQNMDKNETKIKNVL